MAIEIIDISMNLDEKTLVWAEDPRPKLTPKLRTPKDPVNFTWLDFGCHAGTHIDAPFYLSRKGRTIDRIGLSSFYGKCQVIDATHRADEVTKEDLVKESLKEDIVLIKTRNSFDDMKTYNKNHVFIATEAATYLAEKVKLFGFDYLSPERDGKNEVHRIFLEKNIPILENIRLGRVESGTYTLAAFPVKITGIDGAPCRAVLIRGD